MNIKNNKGVTLTILVITIILMFILFGITFSSATDLLKNSQKNKMKTMLYMVKSRAEILLDDYLFEHDSEDQTQRENNLKGVTDDSIGKELGGSYIKNTGSLSSIGDTTSTIPEKNKAIYCSWDENTLKSQGIDTENLAQGDTIIVKYDLENGTVDVASTKGISIDGKSLHFLKDFDE